MPSFFLIPAANGSNSSIVASGVTNWKSFEVAVAVGVVTPAGFATSTRTGVDRPENLRVLAAATNVPGERLGDLCGVRIGGRRKERGRRHDESASADPALEAAFEPERALDRVQSGDPRTCGEPSDGLDGLAASEPRAQYGAAVYGAAVDEHGARATLRTVTTEIGVREAELEVHRLPEALARIDNHRASDAVDLQLDAALRRRKYAEVLRRR